MDQRSKLGALLATLYVAFPRGIDDDGRLLTLEMIEKRHVRPEDLAEAVERLTVTRTTRTAPAIGEILKACGEARSDRLRVEALRNAQLAPGQIERLGEGDIEQIRLVRLLAAVSVYWCHDTHEYVLGSPRSADQLIRAGADPDRDTWRYPTLSETAAAAVRFLPAQDLERPMRLDPIGELVNRIGE